MINWEYTILNLSLVFWKIDISTWSIWIFTLVSIMISGKYQRTYSPVILYGFNFIKANSLQASLLLRQQGAVNFILTVWHVRSNKINRKKIPSCCCECTAIRFTCWISLASVGRKSKLVSFKNLRKRQQKLHLSSDWAQIYVTEICTNAFV